jgi:hypothetical protein
MPTVSLWRRLLSNSFARRIHPGLRSRGYPCRCAWNAARNVDRIVRNPHSARSVRIGSIRDARHDGIKLAATAIAARNKQTQAKMSGSVAVTRNRSPDKKRVSRKDTQPAVMPIKVVRRLCARINRTTLAFVAFTAVIRSTTTGAGRSSAESRRHVSRTFVQGRCRHEQHRLSMHPELVWRLCMGCSVARFARLNSPFEALQSHAPAESR